MSDETTGRIQVTNNDVPERRHLVQPYGERPVVELAQGVVACPICGNNHFRRSRPRFGDLLELLMTRLPVRCTRCSQRQYMEFAVALLAYPPKDQGQRLAVGHETWQNWTTPSDEVQTARPLSTALGPKARNLDPGLLTPRNDPPARAQQPPTRIPSRRREDDNSIW